jgi:hypothetical protein
MTPSILHGRNDCSRSYDKFLVLQLLLWILLAALAVIKKMVLRVE